MKLFKIVTGIILLFTTIYATQTLCFVSNQEEAQNFCAKEQNSTILIPSLVDIDKRIATIQAHIRQAILEDKKKKIVLMSRGFTGTLLAIAQTNLLPYYRQNIHGLVLEDTPANLYQSCMVEKSQEDNQTCRLIKDFQVQLGGQASEIEV